MRRWPFVLAFLLTAPPVTAKVSAPPATPERMTLAPDAEAQWVPFTLTAGNQIRFSVHLDGLRATALLDTGVSVSVVARHWTGRTRLRVTPGPRAVSVGGAVSFGWATGGSLQVGGLTRSGGRLGVVDLPASVTGGAAPVDMLIGRDILDRYALDIDFAAQRFRLLPTGRLPFAGETAPLSILPSQQLYASELRIAGTPLRPVVIDTGDGGTVTLSDKAWRALPVARSASLTSTISYGVSGPVTTDLTILPAVSMGQATLRQAEIRVEPADGFSTRISVAGRIGLGFLQRYRVLLDPRAGRMVLAPNAAAGEAQARSTSGLLFSVGADRLKVIHIMRGGPAADAGWTVGDQICSIDGTAVGRDYTDSALSHWAVGKPGRIVTLGICGGGTRRLKLEQFY